MKIINNQLGVGLLMALVLGGLLASSASSLLYLSKKISESKRRGNQTQTVEEMWQKIQLLMEDRFSCRATFLGTLKRDETSNKVNLKISLDSGVEDYYEINDYSEYRPVAFKGVELLPMGGAINIISEARTPYRYRAKMMAYFHKYNITNGVFTGYTIERELFLIVESSSNALDGVLQDCYFEFSHEATSTNTCESLGGKMTSNFPDSERFCQVSSALGPPGDLNQKNMKEIYTHLRNQICNIRANYTEALQDLCTRTPLVSGVCERLTFCL